MACGTEESGLGIYFGGRIDKFGRDGCGWRGVAGFKDASQFSGLSNWADAWLPFPEMGKTREEQVGEEIKSLLWTC